MVIKRKPEPLISPENFLSEKVVRGLRKRHGDKHGKTREDGYPPPRGSPGENAE